MEPARVEAYDALAWFFDELVDLMTDAIELDSSDVWGAAFAAGLAEQVPYDPEQHADMGIDAEEGDMIHVLSELGQRAIGRANDLRRERETA